MSLSCRGGSFPLPSHPLLLKPSLDGRNVTPDPKTIAHAEDLLVRLENDGVAVRLNLLGQPGEQPDFVVAGMGSALRLCASRRSRLAAQSAVDWIAAGFSARGPRLQAARIWRRHRIPPEAGVGHGSLRVRGRSRHHRAVAAVAYYPGDCGSWAGAKWQLLRTRFQRAIAEGASTSQVTAISVLASIYLQAVDCRKHGRCGTVPRSAHRAQQDTRSHSRAGGDPPGSHDLSRTRSALLRGRNAARVRAGFNHVRQFLHAGFGLLPAFVRAG